MAHPCMRTSLRSNSNKLLMLGSCIKYSKLIGVVVSFIYACNVIPLTAVALFAINVIVVGAGALALYDWIICLEEEVCGLSRYSLVDEWFSPKVIYSTALFGGAWQAVTSYCVHSSSSGFQVKMVYPESSLPVLTILCTHRPSVSSDLTSLIRSNSDHWNRISIVGLAGGVPYHVRIHFPIVLTRSLIEGFATIMI